VTWLLTGGAGYIGAHVAHALHGAGFAVVVLDDLSTGVAARVPTAVPLVEADVRDRPRVLAALREHGVDGVVHLAARKSVPESMARPLYYYEQNVIGFAALLSAMGEVGVQRLVLSSSAAVIGTPPGEFVDERVPARPESPYGRSKLVCEWILEDIAATSGLHYVCLRYFNAAGAGAPELGDLSAKNLIPMIFRALDDGRPPEVFGDDYPTPDGSCIRDYIHVADLSRAHLAAVTRLDRITVGDPPYAQTLNVGRGAGISVLEVMAAVREVTGRDFVPTLAARRPGDPARIVAVADRITAELGWKPAHDLHEIVSSAWTAWQARAAAK
jgi:UDP-glucose 4-epimerase